MASPVAITLDEFAALNDEIAALARAGVPLPEGLLHLSRELPGRLGRRASQVGQQLDAGRSLEEVLRESGDEFGPVYSAVVLTGVRSGRLPAALESLSTTLRHLSVLRRSFAVAMVYPLLLLVIASGLFQFTASRLVPVMGHFLDEMELAPPRLYRMLLAVAHVVQQLLPWLWLGLILLIAWWLYRSARASSLMSGGPLRLPALRRAAEAGRMAIFTELLALLVEREVPLAEAVALAGAASGDRRLDQVGRSLADQIRQGGAVEAIPPGIPPLIGWLILGHTRPDRMVESLRRAAAGYRRRVMYWTTWVGVYLPIFLSAAIGGAVALFYALLVMSPFYYLLHALS